MQENKIKVKTPEDIKLFDVQFRDLLRDNNGTLLTPVNPYVVKNILTAMLEAVKNPLLKIIYEEALENCNEKIKLGINLKEPENLAIERFLDKDTRFTFLQELINENKNEPLSKLSIHRILRNAPTKIFLDLTKNLPFAQQIQVGKESEYLLSFALRKKLDSLVSRCFDNMSLEDMKSFLQENKKDKIDKPHNFYTSFNVHNNRDNILKFLNKFNSVLDSEDHEWIMKGQAKSLVEKFSVGIYYVGKGYIKTKSVNKNDLEFAEKYRKLIPDDVYEMVVLKSKNDNLKSLDFIESLEILKNATSKIPDNDIAVKTKKI